MSRAGRLLSHGRTQDLWQKYCGFIDLGLDEFMLIQERLLMEQVRWFSQCELGKKIIGPKVPASVEEFRRTVPFTTYADYAPYLLEKKRVDVLPEKPAFWIRTSGRSGEYPTKWAPIFQRTWETKPGPSTLGALIFASCRGRNDFALEGGGNILYFMGAGPLGGGGVGDSLREEIAFELERHGVLDPEKATLLKVLAGYRNRMVHFYHEITPKELYEICTRELDDVQRVKETLRKWINANPDHMDETL